MVSKTKLKSINTRDYIRNGLLIPKTRGNDYYVLTVMDHPNPNLSLFWILNSTDEENAQYVAFPVKLVNYWIQTIVLRNGWNKPEKELRNMVNEYMAEFSNINYAKFYNGWQHPRVVARYILNQIDPEQFPL